MNVKAIAEHIGGALVGDQSVEIKDMANLTEAGAGDISFFRDVKYAKQLQSTAAGAVIVPADWDGECAAPVVIKVADPSEAFMAIGEFFAPPPVVRQPGVHATAVIGSDVKLGEGVHVGAFSVIEDGTVVGDHCVIEAQVFIGQRVTLGSECHIYPQVTIREGCLLGERVILHPGVRIGSDGYGYNPKIGADGNITIEKIPQIGIVEIGSDVEVGSNTTIDRARFGRTKIGNSVKIDNLVQIGHNVQVGDYSGIIAQAGIAGSTKIGSGCIIWSQSGVAGHLNVGDRAQLGPASGLTKDLPPGEFYLGLPAVPRRELAASMLLPRTVAKLKKKIAALEAKVKELDKF
ncbi:MAG: UDP-3-O-(3-hydroxymyristoyl)glucosamine N-acyltransferase [Kiritimatiellae bacterium]|jgi:UDP-3-O-[3-hydroxymyristoyl] glucosamine N-acyltransferase|nr:UDP-3-O-(3-hydroxymyristoyl)glucosamine N-acyltransferase [Kiritimatiellia bacterium]